MSSVAEVRNGEEMSKRTKLSTGIILMAVLMLVSAVTLEKIWMYFLNYVIKFLSFVAEKLVV